MAPSAGSPPRSSAIRLSRLQPGAAGRHIRQEPDFLSGGGTVAGQRLIKTGTGTAGARGVERCAIDQRLGTEFSQRGGILERKVCRVNRSGGQEYQDTEHGEYDLGVARPGGSHLIAFAVPAMARADISDALQSVDLNMRELYEVSLVGGAVIVTLRDLKEESDCPPIKLTGQQE